MKIKLKDIILGKPLTEAKSAKALRADYDKAVKKEQALSSLLLVNLEKYKAAKAKGDDKAIAKHTKIAGDLGKKKKRASEVAIDAYQAYEDKISGLHADAELEINEVKTGNKINKARAKAHFKQGENIAVVDKNTGDAIRITDLRQLDAFDSKTHDFAYITDTSNKYTPGDYKIGKTFSAHD